jgi:hypothetical protein
MATSNLSLPTPNASRPTLASWPNQNQPQQPPSPWPGQELPQPQVQPQLRVSSWPSYDVPQQGQSSWSPQPAPQQGQSSWPSQAVPQQGLSMPEPWAEPMAEPVPRRKPKGHRRMIAWSLCVFAGGLAAAAPLADWADEGMAAGIAWVATWAPSFLRPYLPKPIEESAPSPNRPKAGPTPTAAPSAIVPAARVDRRPTAPQITVQPVQPKGLADVAKPKATAPERTAPAAHPRATHSTRGKAAATIALAEPPAPAAKPTTKKRLEGSDPFAGEIDGAAEPATERPAKVASQPASAKSSPAKSGDGLDDLMAGVASGSGKPHAKHSTSREIDAMLKDVQKAEPAPSKPKPIEPASLPSLTASDIATAMASVKTGANACGKRFGQDGAVDLGLTVGKDGKVTNVAVRGKLADSSVAQCVAKAARGASFPRNSGLKFDYRLNLQ